MSARFDIAAIRAELRLHRGSQLAARVVVAVGALVLVGWGLDVAALKSVVPGLVTMKVNTALCFIFSGVALALLGERGKSRRPGLAAGMVWVVLAISTVTLAEYFLARNLGIDQWLIAEPQIAGIPATPGRMALATALGFALVGIALLLLGRNSPRALAVSQVLAALGGLNGLLAFAGYIYRAPSLIDVSVRGVRSNMAVNTALLFVFLAVGILTARPAAGLMATITSRNAGGVTARRMLPFALLVPMVIGWLRLHGQLAGLYETNFGVAFSATTNVIVFSILIFLGARSLNRTSAEGTLVESALRRSEERYRALFDYAPDGIVIADSESYYLDANASICRMLGYSRDELVGLHASDIIVPAEIEHVGSALTTIKAKSEYHREWQFRRKDGSTFEADVIASLMPDGNLMGMIRDITERKRTEKALRENEEQFHATDRRLADIVHGMTEGCFALDAEWRFTFVNDRGEALFRYSREELLGRSIWEVFHKLVGTPMEAHYRRAMAERVPVAFEAFSPIAQRWLDIRLFPTGEGIAAFLLDIQARKLGEQALRESEDQFRTMANSLRKTQARLHSTLAAGSIGTWTWDIPNDRLAADEFTAGMFSIEPEAAAGGLPAEAYLRAVFEEDQAGVADRLARAIESCGHYDIQYRVRQQSGELRWLQAKGRVEGDAAGKALNFHGAVMDITDRKQAEEAIRQLNENLEQRVIERTAQLEAANTELRHSRAELESLFESLPGLYLVLTPDLTIVSASDAYLKATLTTREGLLGRHLFEVFPDNPDDPETTAVANMQASIDRVFRNAAPDTMAIQKHDVRGPGGVFEEHYWSPVNSPVFGADRRIEYIVHRVEEVTDFIKQKRATGDTAELSARVQQMEAEVFQSSQKLQATNQQLEKANRGLEAAGRHKSEFLAGMSHELRTPLNGIIGFSEFLIDEKPGPLLPKQKEYLGDVLNSANHLLQLINDVLDMAKVESGKMDLRPEMFSVRNAIDEVTAVVEGIARKKQVGLAAETGHGLDAVHLDLQKFKQVLYNLLSNAVKFTDSGGSVHIRARRLETDQLEVRVRDTGIGIRSEDMNQLFIEFAQLDSGTARRFEGTGLGLALTRKIVELQGGSIEVESEPGKGSTFTVTLPLSAANG